MVSYPCFIKLNKIEIYFKGNGFHFIFLGYLIFSVAVVSVNCVSDFTVEDSLLGLLTQVN